MSKVYGVFEVYGDGDGYAVFDLIGVEMSESLASCVGRQSKVNVTRRTARRYCASQQHSHRS